jgi:site-specific DNA-methyltransferase (cytosine-N4-specific)
MVTYFADDSVTLHQGDAAAVLAGLPAGSVDCIVTSPPYFGLRDYGHAEQLGAEATPEEYIERMVAVFAEARRVLADDGTCWLNLGDSYYSGRGAPTQPDLKNPARRPPARILDKGGADWAKPKNLLGIPWRVALALQADGWVLRNAIIWHKPNAMPESVTDRFSTRYEHVFLLARQPRYWFDLDVLREPHKVGAGSGPASGVYSTGSGRYDSGIHGSGGFVTLNAAGRNPGDVWSINTQPYPGAHFAVMPRELARRCIAAGCRPGGTVLDPFHGSGTTGAAAVAAGHQYIGIDLNAAYLDLSLATRLANGTLWAEGL